MTEVKVEVVPPLPPPPPQNVVVTMDMQTARELRAVLGARKNNSGGLGQLWNGLIEAGVSLDAEVYASEKGRGR